MSSITNLPPPRDLGPLDKVGHFFEYGVLGWLLARAFAHRNPERVVQWVGFSLIVGAGIGALDEVYQGTVGRTQSTADWVADVAGLTAAAAGMVWLRTRRREKGDGS